MNKKIILNTSNKATFIFCSIHPWVSTFLKDVFTFLIQRRLFYGPLKLIILYTFEKTGILITYLKLHLARKCVTLAMRIYFEKG